jgi:outer membrane protein assembly factor BamA
VGAGYAFGNSSTLPYIKQFAIGGANSIRAFPARSLGPGTYNVRADPKIVGDSSKTRTFFIDQRGDIKLEGNIEHRFDITKVIKGALFFDAGNIWLWRNDSTRQGGQFHRDKFLKQLAVGTGFGLRFDFSFFVLRLDLGIPLRKPYHDPGREWVIKDIDFTNKEWRKDNLLFNIAIGYPF